MADVFSRTKRSAIMARVRGKHTAPEKAVKKLLRGAGLRYRSHASGLPGTPDIVLIDHKTAIFINGCFWHGHRGCRRSKLPMTNTTFWKKKIAGNMRRDSAATKELRKFGWKVLTYWTCAKPKAFALKTSERLLRRPSKSVTCKRSCRRV